MAKRSDYRLDLVKAKPADLAGYFHSALFSEWVTGLSDDDLLAAERAFADALNKVASYRFGRATVKNRLLSDAALSHTFGGGKSAVRGL